jgi:ketosteroid isomerase-like protein
MKRALLIAVLITAASSLALGQTEVTKPDPSKPTAEKVVTQPDQTKPTVEKVVTQPDQTKPTGEKVATPSRAEQAVRQTFDELVSSYAKNDAAVPTRIYAEDFTMTNPFGEVMTKEQRIGQIKPGGVMFDSYSVDDVSVRIYGDTAVVTNRATLAGKRGDQTLAGQYRITQVFVKKGGNWQLVAAQSTPIVEQAKQ